MHDSVTLRARQRTANIGQDLLNAIEWQRTKRTHFALQRATRHILHDQSKAIIAEPARAVQHHNVGMLEAGHRTCFSLQTSSCLVIFDVRRSNDFDRYSPTQLSLARQIHHCRSAATELTHDLVIGIQIREARQLVAFEVRLHARLLAFGRLGVNPLEREDSRVFQHMLKADQPEPCDVGYVKDR